LGGEVEEESLSLATSSGRVKQDKEELRMFTKHYRLPPTSAWCGFRNIKEGQKPQHYCQEKKRQKNHSWGGGGKLLQKKSAGKEGTKEKGLNYSCDQDREDGAAMAKLRI